MAISTVSNAANQAKLDNINANKEKDIISEAEKSAKQELLTAKAGRTKTLRYA